MQQMPIIKPPPQYLMGRNIAVVPSGNHNLTHWFLLIEFLSDEDGIFVNNVPLVLKFDGT